MEKQILFREFQEKDTEEIENIIIEAWHYHDLCSSKTARKLAKVFLSSCLANQTYTQVAIENETPIGVIMGKNISKHRCPIKYRLKQAGSIIRLFLSGEGRRVSKIFANVSEVDKRLLRETNRAYQGELAFFAVSSSARGKGVGKELFRLLLKYMKGQRIENIYLFTDTSCNYGFYEHQGMIRRGAIEQNFVIHNQRADMTFFLYDYIV